MNAAIQVIRAKQELLNSDKVCSYYILELADLLGIDSGDLYINNIVLDSLIEKDNTFKNIDKLIENEPQYLIFSHSLFLTTIERKQTINSLFPYLKIGLNFNHSKNANANESFGSDLFRNWVTVFLSVNYDFQIKNKS